MHYLTVYILLYSKDEDIDEFNSDGKTQVFFNKNDAKDEMQKQYDNELLNYKDTKNIYSILYEDGAYIGKSDSSEKDHFWRIIESKLIQYNN